MINLADDSKSDSSDVDIDIAGCDFYQNIEKKERNNNNKNNNIQTKEKKNAYLLT